LGIVRSGAEMTFLPIWGDRQGGGTGGLATVQNRMLLAVAAIAVAAFVAACTVEVPTPVASDGTAPGVADAGVPVAPRPTSTRRDAAYIVVRPGQSVSHIAAEQGVPQRAIIAANNLTPPYKLEIGHRLLVPRAEARPAPAASAARHIVVEPGRSVSRIAAKYQVPQRAIIAANHLTPPYKLEIGRRLIIPGAAAPQPARIAAAAPAIIPIDGPAFAPAQSTPLPPAATTGVTASRAEAAASPTPPLVSASARPLSPQPGTAEHGRAASPAEPVGAAAAASGNQSPVVVEPLPAPSAANATMMTGQAPAPSSTAAPPASAAFAAPPPATPAAVPAAAPAGVTCPPGTTGMWSVDVIKVPVYVCRGSYFRG
jgi:LysM repeat protein